MAEPKRYEWKFNGGDSGMFSTEDGLWVSHDDYTTLSREVERLRKVEVAAKELVSYYATHGHSSYYTGALADAIKEAESA